jgi:hypothetical protein
VSTITIICSIVVPPSWIGWLFPRWLVSPSLDQCEVVGAPWARREAPFAEVEPVLVGLSELLRSHSDRQLRE